MPIPETPVRPERPTPYIPRPPLKEVEPDLPSADHGKDELPKGDKPKDTPKAETPKTEPAPSPKTDDKTDKKADNKADKKADNKTDPVPEVPKKSE